MNTSKKRKALNKYTGKGGFGSTVVPMKLGGGRMKPFDPAATRANFESWSGAKLPPGSTPGYARLTYGAKAAGPAALALAGAEQIGKLVKGLVGYKNELTGETDSYTKAGELADKLRSRYVAKRKK